MNLQETGRTYERKIQSVFWICFLFNCCALGSSWRAPVACSISRDQRTLYVAFERSREVAFYDLSKGTVLRCISLSKRPTGMLLIEEKNVLCVTCSQPEGEVILMDAVSGEVLCREKVGYGAVGPCFSEKRNLLFVCNRFENSVSVLDILVQGKIKVHEQRRIEAVREPIASAVTPDGSLLVVASHLPEGRSNRYGVAACVTIYDLNSWKSLNVRLPNGATGLRGLWISYDGSYAFVTHILGRYELPTVQVERGWINCNALGIVDLRKKKLLNSVLLDELDRGAGNPWGVAGTDAGDLLCVAHAGTNELSVIRLGALLEKLKKVPPDNPDISAGEVLYDDRNEWLDYFRRLRAERAGSPSRDPYRSDEVYSLGTASGVPNDLTFISEIRFRLPLFCKGPRFVLVRNRKAYVLGYFSDTLHVVSLRCFPPKEIRRLTFSPGLQLLPHQKGEALFNDATLCSGGWQSCASCHPDGRSDGLNWDLVNDGMGNPKNTKSLVGSFLTPPAMSTGVRASASAAVRAGLKHILFSDKGEEVARLIDAYIRSLRPVPSPALRNGQLTPSALRGKKLFFSKSLGCVRCHPPPLYTDKRLHNIGSASPIDLHQSFDVPTLIELYRTAPYLHDGRFATVEELLKKGKGFRGWEGLKELGEKELQDLEAFLNSL